MSFLIWIIFSLFTLFSFIFSTMASAQYYPVPSSSGFQGSYYRGSYGGVSMFSSSDHYRKGGEAAVTIWGKHVGYRTSALFYSTESNIETDEDSSGNIYGGFAFSGLVSIGDVVRPYVGLGVFGGSNWGCGEDEDRREDSSDQDCSNETYSILALFPEVGLAINLGPMQVTPFARVYIDTEVEWHRLTGTYGVLLSLKM